MIARVLFGLVVVVALASASLIALLPSYMSPTSRLWSADWGYPAVQRRLGRPIPLETVVAGGKDLFRRIAATGYVSYENLVPVNIEVAGIVRDLRVRPGDKVQEGLPLLTIDAGGYSIRLARIDVSLKEKQLEDAQQDLERKRKNFEKQIVSVDDLRAHEALARDAIAALDSSKERLNAALATRSQVVTAATAPPDAGLLGPETLVAQTHKDRNPQGGMVDRYPVSDIVQNGDALIVTSPVSGTVVDVAVNQGENIIATRQKAMLIGDRLVFEAFVDQRYYSEISTGDMGTVSLTSSPGQEYDVRVARVSPVVADEKIARSTGQPPLTFSVILEFVRPKPDSAALASGMPGYVLLTRIDDSLAVPTSALVRYSGGSGYLFVLGQDGTVEGRAVAYSVSDQGLVGIKSGVVQGERVVISGQTALLSGDRACAIGIEQGCPLSIFSR